MHRRDDKSFTRDPLQCKGGALTNRAVLLASAIAAIAFVSSRTTDRLPLRKEFFRILSICIQVLRSLRRPHLPTTWPPHPRLLIRWGGAASLASTIVLVVIWLCTGAVEEEGEESCKWIQHAQQQRRKVLLDVLRPVMLRRLCQAVPRLRSFIVALEAQHDQSVLDTFTTIYTQEEMSALANDDVQHTLNEDAGADLGATAEPIADAAEKLSKVDREGAAVWVGYTVAAALTSVEVQQSVRVVEADDSGSNVDALRLRLETAEELIAFVRMQCPRRRISQRITGLCDEPLRVARKALRARRAAQWRCVAHVLWRFRSTAPFIVLSSALSSILGAFSAMRLHYQAIVINMATTAAVGNHGSQSVDAIASSSVGETVSAMVVSEIVSQIAEFARTRLASRGKMQIVRDLKVALFEALLRQDLSYLEQCDLWQLRTLIGSCGTTVGQVIDFPAVLVEASIRLIAAIVVLWRQSPKLTWFVAVALPSRLLLSRFLDMVGEWLEQRSSPPDFRGQINSCWSALVRPASLRTMRAFAREPAEVSCFRRFLTMHDRVQEHGQLIYRFMEPLRTLLEHSTEIATLWIGGRLAMRGEMKSGDLSSFVLVAQGALDGARFVRAAAVGVSNCALGPMAQMASLLAQQPRIGLDEPPLANMPDPHIIKWRVSFENVSFAYPQRPSTWVLRNLSFDASEGEFHGILGETGSGKSTIFILLLRFYDPTEGRILLDGRDLCEYNPLWLRRYIGYVSQELVLCQKTVRENLTYGCTSLENSSLLFEPGDEEARSAMRTAQCEHTFFDASTFPNLWHTVVGDGGSNISGGERQRLALARAILKRPRLLLLDEVTSALDELSQARLQETLEELRTREGLTVLCIAHRLSNLSRADRLLVVDGGQTVESGTPEELLKLPGGRFAEYARTHRDSVPGAALAS